MYWKSVSGCAAKAGLQWLVFLSSRSRLDKPRLIKVTPIICSHPQGLQDQSWVQQKLQDMEEIICEEMCLHPQQSFPLLLSYLIPLHAFKSIPTYGNLLWGFQDVGDIEGMVLAMLLPSKLLSSRRNLNLGLQSRNQTF